MDTPRRRRANKSYLTPKGRALAWLTRIHRRLYTASGGIIGPHIFQIAERGSKYPLRLMRVLLLTTTGRKSGLERTVPLPYFEYEGRILLVASFAGGPKNPAWYHNIRANPAVKVHQGRQRYPATARILQGEEREHYWELLSADWPRYGVYQASTPRTIPLVEVVRDDLPTASIQ
jgi:deazaflavin-dependent oxidoreductase (nitroreductase family)